MRKKIFLTRGLMLVLLVFVSTFVVLLGSPKIKKVTSETLIDPYINIRLNPTIDKHYFNVNLENPYIEHRPSSILHLFTKVAEKIKTNNNSTDHVFIARKRLNELYFYRDSAYVLGDYSTIDGLKASLVRLESNIISMLFNRDKFFTWEMAYAGYIQELEREIAKLKNVPEKERLDRLYVLKNYILRYSDAFRRSIVSLNRTDQEKAYLLKLNDNVARYLADGLIGRLPIIDNFLIEYNLSSLHNDKEYGSYSFFVSKNFPQKYINDYSSLSLDSSSIANSQISSERVYFQNAEINEDSNKILLAVPKIDLADNGKWEKMGNNDESYYYQDVQLPDGVNKLLFLLQNANNAPLTFQLLLADKKVDPKTYKVVDSFYTFSDEVLSPNASFEHFVEFITDRTFKKVRIMIKKGYSSVSTFSGPSTLHAIPLIEPKINLVRTKYLHTYTPGVLYTKASPFQYEIKITNPNKSVYELVKSTSGMEWWETGRVVDKKTWTISVIYLPFVFYIIIVSGLVILFFMQLLLYLNVDLHKKRTQTYIHLVKIFAHKVAKTFIFIFSAAQLFRFPILLVSTIGLTIYIFIIQTHNTQVLLFILSLWIISLGLYQRNLKICLKFSFILLTLAIVTMIFHVNMKQVEKILGVAYIFALTGATWSLIFSEKSSKIDLTLPFLDLLEKDIASLIRRFPKPLDRIVLSNCGRIKLLIIRLYGPFPISRVNRVYFYLKLFLTAFLISGFFLLFQHYNDIVRRYALNPLIKNYQPRLAYRSTKIRLSGGDFGWKQNEDVRLVSENGRIDTDLWTPEKIIFTIPLDWSYGNNKIWIEKPAIWKGRSIVTKSNAIIIRIIPATKTFNKDDDLFFYELKKADQEVQNLNEHR